MVRLACVRCMHARRGVRSGEARRLGVLRACASRSYSLLFGTEELAGPSGGGRAEESTSHSASGAAFGPCPRVTS